MTGYSDEQQRVQSYDSMDSHSIETVSTCVSKYTSTARTRSSNNNFEYVLQLLDVTFKGFSADTVQERPVESMGAIVQRILQVDSLLDFIQVQDQPALICPKTLGQVSHRQLYGFLRNQFNLAKFNLCRGARVATCLTESPTLAVLLLGIITYCTCTPCNANLSPEELLEAFQTMNVQAVVLPLARLTDNTDRLPDLLRSHGIQLIGLAKSQQEDIFFSLHPDPCTSPSQEDDDHLALLNQPDDVVLVLQTSGTSGKKKSVPYRLRQLCVSTTCVAASIGISKDHINVNMMPLYHVGGIIRSLFVPLFTGSIMIQFENFDAGIFWDILSSRQGLFWYYAVPTMHQAIVLECRQRLVSRSICERVKTISNGGGSLAPNLAQDLQLCFPNAVVMPSYGMTECMPMTAPPRDYALECQGSSGLVVGPEMAIVADGQLVAGNGVTGHIMVRGPPCFEGYENVDPDTTFDSNGWFDTGDMGYFEDGYLYITGRSKEIINRGGEVISPFEIEQALLAHPKLDQVLVFTTPHETLQETIAAVLVVKDNEPRPDLRSLRTFLEHDLHPSKWPQLLVYMDDLPKSAVNKTLRINLSQRLNLPMVMEADGNIHLHQHLYEADCPPRGTPLSEPIACRPVSWSPHQVLHVLLTHPDIDDCATHVHPTTNQFTLFLVVAPPSKTANTTTTTLPIDSFSTILQMDDSAIVQHEESNDSSRASTMMNGWSRFDKDVKDAVLQRFQVFLQQHLHDYMLPKRMLLVDHLLKRNQDGSLADDDAAHLLQQNRLLDDASDDDPVELVLRDLFAQVLGLPRADYPLDGDFFDHGGNSLKSGSLFSMIRLRLDVDLPLTLLYEKHARSPTLLAPHCYERIDAKTHPLFIQGYAEYMKRKRVNSQMSYKTIDSFTMDGLPPTPNALDNKKKKTTRYQTPRAFRAFGTQKYKDRMAKRPPIGTYNPFSFITMLIQGLPLFFFNPLTVAVRWLIFAIMLGSLSQVMPTTTVPQLLRLLQVILALLLTNLICLLLAPVITLLSKWILIGKFRAGTYPLWSWYYLRWWLSHQMITMAGPGFMAWHSSTFTLYLRLLGANVGRGCSINPNADIGEFDLLTLGDGCYLDKVVLRPFHLAPGHMVLSPIVIGKGASVGFRTICVPDTTVPDDHVVGPLTTTYNKDLGNAGSCAHKDTPEGLVLLDAVSINRQTDKTHPLLMLLVVYPTLAITYLISMIPWMIVMYLLSKDLSLVKSAGQGSLFSKLVLYFATPLRVGYHLLAVLVRHNVVPLFQLVLAICLKRVLGPSRPGPRTNDSQWHALRYTLFWHLLHPEFMNEALKIFGSHYEFTSVVYRLLGAKVGKRIYWPGSALQTVDYELLEVGDDVVFGSRSAIFCVDAHDRLPVKIKDGSMVADNCVLLPGSQVGNGAVLGTGGLLRKGGLIPDGSAWFGSHNGNAVKFRDQVPLSEKKQDDEALDKPAFINPGTPFGRAFYQGQAKNYRVLGLWFVLPFNFLLCCFGSVYWGCAMTTAIQVSAAYVRDANATPVSRLAIPLHNFLVNLFHDGREWIEMMIVLSALMILWNAMTLIGLTIEVGAKWLIFGQRQPGSYNWDESSYCQRWQFLLGIQQMFRRRFVSLTGGSGWILIYFRALGCRIGKRVCLYPNGADPAMTEPDLVMLEDDVAVDMASLICHFNTLGNFMINPLKVGAGSVLQSGARLASGATMLEDCTLLSHTLILPGAMTDRGSVWQSYPGEQVKDH
ncbi:hypothetical protein DM01DRAFT_1339686 [Hesseltinella vesiculosa]|uniref:Carrier domain-containing protein n=1 Tax=Hesseltinella vesiculosa TaxID=101127 RepID=A0A1X2G636_9FUNG|nr:hypothetical protein DM01DRAFT_1339686 [Hesseltinella vesiculosa]